MEKPTKPQYPIRVVCSAKVEVQGGALGVSFHTITPEGGLGRQLIYKPGKGIPNGIGCIYTVTAADPEADTIYPGTFKYEGYWPNEDEVASWQANADALELKRRSASLAKKAETRRIVCETMAPIRRIYEATNYSNRLALEVLVLRYLRTGGVD